MERATAPGPVTGEGPRAPAGEGPARQRVPGNTVGQRKPGRNLSFTSNLAGYLEPATLPLCASVFSSVKWGTGVQIVDRGCGIWHVGYINRF